MLRRNAREPAAEVTTTRPRATKIRKRCALSPSSGASTGPLTKLRLKRGVVVVLGRSRKEGAASPRSSRKIMSESSWNRQRSCRADGTHSRSSSMSARKLVGGAWQTTDQDGPDVASDAAARRSSAHRRCASSVEISKRWRTKSIKALDADDDWLSHKLSNGAAREVHRYTGDQDWARSAEERMAQMQDMYSSLKASKELVRVLTTIWGPGDLDPSTASILYALRSELDLARAHTRQLVREQSYHGDEVESLKKRLAEEAHSWRSRHREKAAATVKMVVAELDGERRSRRRAERVNSKLGKALAETENSLRAAELELERETRSRERLEKVLDELVRCGASGVCRGEVEEMRREAVMGQEELGREREMLRLADEFREERVQMKLLEARLQFEEKNAVVEQLRGKLEVFLETKKDHQESPASDLHHADATIDDHFHLADPPASQGANGVAAVFKRLAGEGEDEDDRVSRADESEGSDMHSIELNVDGNNKHCSWSYTTASKEMSTRMTSSLSASDRGKERATDPGAGTDFNERRSPEESEGGWQWDDGGCSNRTSRDLDEDSERYEAIKSLREQMLAGHGLVFLSHADDGDAGNTESERHRHGLM